MSDYQKLAIAVIAIVNNELLEVEDREVPGVYSVSVPKLLNDETMARVALDGFHESEAVGCLDDFVFRVFDPETLKVLEEASDSESYTMGHLARDVQKVPDLVPDAIIESVL